MKTMYAAAILEVPETTTDLSPVTERCIEVTRKDLEHLEAGIAEEVLPACVDETQEPVKLRCMGRTIMAQPLDTRRFVRVMARYTSLN